MRGLAVFDRLRTSAKEAVRPLMVWGGKGRVAVISLPAKIILKEQRDVVERLNDARHDISINSGPEHGMRTHSCRWVATATAEDRALQARAELETKGLVR